MIIKNFEVGDRVEATSGQCKGIKGQVLEIDNPALGKQMLIFLAVNYL